MASEGALPVVESVTESSEAVKIPFNEHRKPKRTAAEFIRDNMTQSLPGSAGDIEAGTSTVACGSDVRRWLLLQSSYYSTLGSQMIYFLTKPPMRATITPWVQAAFCG